MAARKRKGEGEDARGWERIRKRRPRPGPRRCVSLCLCADHATWLDVYAARTLTIPSEVVMDLIDQARRRRPGEAAAVEDAA